MLKSKFNTDYAFLGSLGVLIGYTLYDYAVNNVVLNINNYLAFAGWVLSFVLFSIKNNYAKYAIAILLLAGLFELLNFMPYSFYVNSVNFSPLVFLLSIAYYIVNRKTVHRFFSKRLYDNSEERAEKENKMVEFYFKKFSGYNGEEFDTIIKNYNSYPQEAKIAIDRIKESKI